VAHAGANSQFWCVLRAGAAAACGERTQAHATTTPASPAAATLLLLYDAAKQGLCGRDAGCDAAASAVATHNVSPAGARLTGGFHFGFLRPAYLQGHTHAQACRHSTQGVTLTACTRCRQLQVCSAAHLAPVSRTTHRRTHTPAPRRTSATAHQFLTSSWASSPTAKPLPRGRATAPICKGRQVAAGRCWVRLGLAALVCVHHPPKIKQPTPIGWCPPLQLGPPSPLIRLITASTRAPGKARHPSRPASPRHCSRW
jgi:hypothetical protein